MYKKNDSGTQIITTEKGTVSESMFDKTKSKVSENLSNAAGKVHQQADAAQDYLNEKVENVEDFMRQKTYQAGDITRQTLEKANSLGHRAGDALENSSEYVKNFDAAQAKESVINTFRERPEFGMALAGAFGIVIGLLIGRRRKS